MTAGIVNLRLARKRKARDADSQHADQRRITCGRTKAEKMTAKAQAEAAEKHLDAHRRDPALKSDA